MKENLSQLSKFSHMWGVDRDSYVIHVRRRDDGSFAHMIFKRGEVPGAILIDDDTIAPLVVEQMLKHGVQTFSDFREGVERGFFRRL